MSRLYIFCRDTSMHVYEMKFISSLDKAGVGLCLFVVVDAYEEQVGGVLGHFGWVFLPLDLRDGGVCILVVFQFYHDGRG